MKNKEIDSGGGGLFTLLMKSESFRVGRGRFSVVVYRVRWDGGEGWQFKANGKAVTRVAKAEATKEAKEYLKNLAAGEEFLGRITGEQRAIVVELAKRVESVEELREVLRVVEDRRRGAKLAEMVEEYLADKEGQKGKTSHLRQVRAILEDLAAAFPGVAMGTISTRELEKWFEAKVGGLSASRRNNIRAAAVALWNWAGARDYLTSEQAAVASRLRRKAPEEKEIRIATIPETLYLLRNVAKEWRLPVVLGLFAGMRPEQTAPDSRRGKVGLCRSAISLEDGVIYVSREVSKTFAHVIPISDCLRAWLAWAGWEEGQFFPVATMSMAQARETVRLGRLMDEEFDRDEGWPHDWLRHTYGSHRNALVRNIAQVAEEMGTSPKMMHAHYHQPRPRSDGEEFFALRPADLLGDQVVRMRA